MSGKIKYMLKNEIQKMRKNDNERSRDSESYWLPACKIRRICNVYVC